MVNLCVSINIYKGRIEITKIDQGKRGIVERWEKAETTGERAFTGDLRQLTCVCNVHVTCFSSVSIV